MLNMNNHISDSLDDQVFFFAEKVVANLEQKTWQIHVIPPQCLVSQKPSGTGLPTIVDLRQARPRKAQTGHLEIYEGHILFSDGVIAIVNGRLLMLRRDAEAPVDPLMWTSPAGRCDREPKLTGFKEFYEEIILWDKKQKNPIFIIFPESEPYLEYLKEVYLETLVRKNCAIPAAQWVYLSADIPSQYALFLDEVRTFFGEGEDAEEYEGKFFVFWDEACNTLELRLVASVTVDKEVAEAIECFDGEYDRPARLFTLEEFMALPEKELVATMVEFRKRLTR